MKKISWNQLWKHLRKNPLSNIFGKQKLLMAFEFGIVLSDVAKQLGIEMTPEIVVKAEKLLLNEYRNHSANHFACNMSSYTLAILEPKD